MANTIKLRRSAVQSAVPSTSQLSLGELAVNTYDGRLFFKKDNGTESIVELQPALVSGSHVKTINGNSIVGSGDLAVAAMEYPGAGIAVSTGSAWSTSKTAPSGDFVGTSDSQTLSNKTLSAPTITGATLNDGYTEEVFAVSGTTPALSPTNGSIQTWTLSGTSTPTAGTWAAGQSMTLMIDDGSAYTVTWTSLGVTWKTDSGSAPTLQTTGYTAIVLWKVGTTIFGARVGNA